MMEMMQQQMGTMIDPELLNEVMNDPELAPLMDQLDDLLQQLEGTY